MMNKIIIENDKIIESDLDYQIDSNSIFNIQEICFNIKKDMDLKLTININKETKNIICFNIFDDVALNLSILTSGEFSKIQYKYHLGFNAHCNIEKLNIVNGISEMIIANIDEGSSFNYLFKSIASNKENYDYMIYHDGKNSSSNIINHSINENGSIYYQISSFIPQKMVGCSANQYNRIINLTNNKCEIRPDLYIDCDDVSANHSALIDKFSDKELFYLKSRGINEEMANKLLMKGFLMSKLNNQELIDLIQERYGGE